MFEADVSQGLRTAMQHLQAGRFPEAEVLYREILTRDPACADAWHFLGVIAHQLRRHEVAAELIQRAALLAPNNPAIHSNLGDVYYHLHRLDDAAASLRRALALRPAFPNALNNLGMVLTSQDRLAEAVVCFEQALALKPDLANGCSNLGSVLTSLGRLDEAEAQCRKAVALQPGFAGSQNNLGNVFRDQGRLDEALDRYQQALALAPDLATANANRLFLLQFHPAYDAPAIFAAHRDWATRHVVSVPRLGPPQTHDRNPERRLRIGYVSPNFRDHVVGRNLVPLFQHHLREQFEVFCYSDARSPDLITDRLRAGASTWRDTAGLSDEQLAHLVRADRIDLLVDLTLHMTGSRLLAFARKPAHVQVTFAGYPGTTGLPAIDYRLTDPYLDPPGLLEAHYAEKSIRLPDSFWCYAPSDDDPAVRPLPVAARGFVTFGCLNHFCKINPAVLRLWARVLRAVEHSRLRLLAVAGAHRQRAVDALAAEGIAADRVEFSAPLLRLRYLELYHEIDLGLDTLPYNGHSTSLDSYWMGVPVVTLLGQTVVGRAGWSQLSNLGLTELAAHSPDEFVRIASELARDRPRLATLRASLRERMQRSPLMDAPRFARNIEAAYRTMWKEWCDETASVAGEAR